MGIPSDRRFLRTARRQRAYLFPHLPRQDALHKRRARLAETIEWPVGKGDAGQELAASVARLGARVVRFARRGESPTGPHPTPIRRRIEWVSLTREALLSLERHSARTPFPRPAGPHRDAAARPRSLHRPRPPA